METGSIAFIGTNGLTGTHRFRRSFSNGKGNFAQGRNILVLATTTTSIVLRGWVVFLEMGTLATTYELGKDHGE